MIGGRAAEYHLASFANNSTKTDKILKGDRKCGTLIVFLDIDKWKNAKRPSLDDVDALSHGKPTKSKVGSRATPHHLYRHEHTVFLTAKRKEYCVVQCKSRVNVANIWYLWCLAKGIPCVHVYHSYPPNKRHCQDVVTVDLSTVLLSKGKGKGLKRSKQLSAVLTDRYHVLCEQLRQSGYLSEIPPSSHQIRGVVEKGTVNISQFEILCYDKKTVNENWSQTENSNDHLQDETKILRNEFVPLHKFHLPLHFDDDGDKDTKIGYRGTQTESINGIYDFSIRSLAREVVALWKSLA
eukprot:jgi/Bigna1/147320/aug1.140_g22028